MCWLCAYRKTQARQARERLRKIAARKMRHLREQTIKRAGWVILVSTLPAKYSVSELFWLYRSRWQIECLIKAMKQLLPLVQLRSYQPELIRTTLLAWVLVWMRPRRSCPDDTGSHDGGSSAILMTSQRGLAQMW